jgi:fucose permease
MFCIYILYVLILAANADIALVWKQKAGPYLQAMQFAFSVGAIISPLVAEPFLAKQLHFQPILNRLFQMFQRLCLCI